ncbi:MAG TPA: hypothetical protein VLK25_04725 [Allosphingosinicella sp.]|nr:hypothetical protein [Allosphingosinicella sp.]
MTNGRAMIGLRWALGAALLASAGQVPAITPEQAQSLPVAELARLVLGESGALFVDVDRPTVPSCGMVCPSLTDAERRVPPLWLGMTFYQRSSAASWRWPEGWTGLCKTLLVAVSFDNGGRVSGLSQEVRYGVPHGMSPLGPIPSERRVWEARKRDAETACQARAPRALFVADEEISAYRAMIALHLFAEAARRPEPLPFRFQCWTQEIDCTRAGLRPADLTARLGPERVGRVSQVDCNEPYSLLRSFGWTACYRIDLNQPADSVFVEVEETASAEIVIKRFRYVRSIVTP